MPDDEEIEGEVLTIDEPESDVRDLPDGGALVTLEGASKRSDSFGDNLAETLPETEMHKLASQLLDLIERDKESRKKRDEQYEEGLRRTGLGDDAPGGAKFEGASKVVHPMLVNATIDFAARSIKEICPPQGPAKDFIPGKVTPEKIMKARRKTDFMNWQLMVQCQAFRGELEQTLTQVPMGGAQYLKLHWDEGKNRPDPLFVPIDDMFLPFAATSFYSAHRKTHRFYMTQLEYDQRVDSGEYRDLTLVAPPDEPEESAAQKANDKIEGREPTGLNEDGLRTAFDVYVLTDLAGDDLNKGKPAPYIVTIDETSMKVLAIYRNWDELDPAREELQWFVEFPFVPWRGAYPIGLPNMIGGLSAAATGALRALLDSAHLQNVATGLRLKGLSGQDIQPQVGEIAVVEGSIMADDIRKLYMPVPFNPPSTVLFSLLGFLQDAGQNTVRTALDDAADINANAPVGTTLARIEQGMVVFSAIHGRLHDAMARLLKILHRLNAMYLNDEEVKRETGEPMATRADFDGPMDVVPVSDPNIFSEAQRFAQVQAVAQRADLKPQLYDARKVEERILDTLKIPNPEELLAPALEPKEQNAIVENVAASVGRPVNAFPEQDHLAHLKTHVGYMMSPLFGSNPLIAPRYIPVMLGHLAEHIAWWYASAVFTVSNAVTGADIGVEMREIESVDERKALDRLLAEAGATAIEVGDEQFQQLPQMIQQAMALMQQFAPQPPVDPYVQVEGEKVKQRAAESERRDALKGQEMQAKAAEGDKDRASDMALEQLQQGHEDKRKAAELETRLAIDGAANATAKELKSVDVLSNGGVNPMGRP